MTEQEIVQAEEQLPDQQSDAVQEQVIEKPAQEQSKADIHWEQAREVMKLQKQQIEQLSAELMQLKQPKQNQDVDEFESLDPEDYLTVGKFKELTKKLTSKESAQTAQQVVGEFIQQQKILDDEKRMREKHEDYDYVIENFAMNIINNDAALAYKIKTSKNPAETAYKLAKMSDEYEESNMKKPTSPKAEKILKNSTRPVSSNSVGSNLQTQADDFSKMSPSQIWEMSQKYARKA